MSQLYQNLIERIRGEVSDLEQVVARARQSWSMVQKAPMEEYVYVDSVALTCIASIQAWSACLS